MGREHPMQVSPAGKPHIADAGKKLTAKGKFDIHSGHGTEYGQTTAKTSYPGTKSIDNGANRKGGLTVRSGHGTGYSSETSRG